MQLFFKHINLCGPADKTPSSNIARKNTHEPVASLLLIQVSTKAVITEFKWSALPVCERACLCLRVNGLWSLFDCAYSEEMLQHTHTLNYILRCKSRVKCAPFRLGGYTLCCRCLCCKVCLCWWFVCFLRSKLYRSVSVTHTNTCPCTHAHRGCGYFEIQSRLLQVPDKAALGKIQ